VGYELYLQKKEADCHNILFAAVGPEMIMYALQNPAFKYPEDFAYFMRFDKEPMSIFVRANSPFQSLEQLVDEAKKRPVIVATSRMPHAATIGMLLIADETGAKFNLVPYGGGAKTVNAVMTGEAEAIAIHTGNGTALGDQIRFLGIFDDVNPVPAQTGNAPTVNDALGLELPPMGSSRALGIHRKAIESFPDRYEILKSSAKAVMEDPAYADGIDRIGVPREFIAYGDEQACETEAKFFMELAKRYEDVLKKG
jgi:tripartite-type tricarboxylate transporter receptor subunit TctC